MFHFKKTNYNTKVILGQNWITIIKQLSIDILFNDELKIISTNTKNNWPCYNSFTSET
ncbi:hypothetical protein QSE00_10435 [Arenibacter sp. M-2]|uniref:hypothetical protein n=1 Tax=Arenibacter sp. M-2 TaxID=3053612 RepID=UPI0025707871|nr:hypothetical protein [Arenibacter sp. M-2]MDL5512233.1 hypothetical protein [Arenibacter sp. M-2]